MRASKPSLSKGRAWSRRGLCNAGLCLLALVLSSCLAPTLPLPPPSRPEISAPDSSGQIKIAGRVRSRATAFAQNERTFDIVGKLTDETGRYELTMSASSGDRIRVWQSVGTDESESVVAIVPSSDPEALGAAGASGAPSL